MRRIFKAMQSPIKAIFYWGMRGICRRSPRRLGIGHPHIFCTSVMGSSAAASMTGCNRFALPWLADKVHRGYASD